MSFIGVVSDDFTDDHAAHFGACFAWGDGRHFITADHVIEAAEERGASTLTVAGPGEAAGVLLAAPVSVVARDPARDVALLRWDAEPVEPFRYVAGPLVGQVVGSLAFVGDSMLQLVSRVTGLGFIRGTSTAATRGSEDGADVAYGFHGVFLVREVERGFCGAPLLGADGEVLGVISKTRDGRGVASRFDQAVPWLAEHLNLEVA
jgi:S1-C subfamily serine protease